MTGKGEIFHLQIHPANSHNREDQTKVRGITSLMSVAGPCILRASPLAAQEHEQGCDRSRAAGVQASLRIRCQLHFLGRNADPDSGVL